MHLEINLQAKATYISIARMYIMYIQGCKWKKVYHVKIELLGGETYFLVYFFARLPIDKTESSISDKFRISLFFRKLTGATGDKLN